MQPITRKSITMSQHPTKDTIAASTHPAYTGNRKFIFTGLLKSKVDYAKGSSADLDSVLTCEQQVTFGPLEDSVLYFNPCSQHDQINQAITTSNSLPFLLIQGRQTPFFQFFTVFYNTIFCYGSLESITSIKLYYATLHPYSRCSSALHLFQHLVMTILR